MKYQLEELSIELTARCACKCIMCSSGSSPKALPNELATPEIITLIQDARELGATVLSFSGDDPIQVYESLPNYVRVAIDLGYEKVLLYTTGISGSARNHAFGDANIAISGDRLSILLGELDRIPYSQDHLTFVFSLHSHQAHVHNYIMGMDNAWSVTTNSIMRVILHGYAAWVHMVPMLPNWDHVISTRNLCMHLGVEKMSLLRFVPQTRGKKNNRKLALNLAEFEKLQRTMASMSYYTGSTEPDVSVRFGCPIDFRHTVDNTIDAKIHPCHAGTDLMLVRPQGDVHPCAAWKTLPDDANVRESSLKAIWESSHVFQAIRKFRETGWQDLGGPCSICSYIGSCKGGCPAQKLHWLGININEPDIDDMYWTIADPLCPLCGLGGGENG